MLCFIFTALSSKAEWEKRGVRFEKMKGRRRFRHLKDEQQ
jgi:hypothetical protein